MDDNIRNAIAAVRSGTSEKEAASEHGISRTTLRRRLKNVCPNSVGRPTAFTTYELDTFAIIARGSTQWTNVYQAENVPTW